MKHHKPLKRVPVDNSIGECNELRETQRSYSAEYKNSGGPILVGGATLSRQPNGLTKSKTANRSRELNAFKRASTDKNTKSAIPFRDHTNTTLSPMHHNSSSNLTSNCIDMAKQLLKANGAGKLLQGGSFTQEQV